MPISFEPEAKIDFEPEAKPQIDFEPEGASVAQMAAATRHTVGVVGRAVAATNFAIENQPEVFGIIPDQTKDQWGRPLDPRGRNPAEAAPNLFPSRTPESPLAALTTPLLKLPRVTAQEVTDAFSYLASMSPDLTEEESQAVIDNTMAPGNLEKVVAGAQRAAVAIPESFTSPLGIATLGTGALPAAAGRAVAAGFTIDLASHLPAQITELKEAVASGDSERITEASGNLLASGGMMFATGKHAATKPNPAKILGERLLASIKETEFVDPTIAALKQVAPLTAEAVVRVNPEPTPELKPGDVLPDLLPPVTQPLWSSSTVEPGKAIYLSSRKADAEVYSLGRPVEQYQPTVRKTFDPETSTDAELVKLYDAEGGLYEAPQKQSFRDALAAKGYDSIKGTEVGAGGPAEWLVVLDPSSLKAPSETPLTTAAVESVKEPAPDAPAPAGVVPPTAEVLPQEPSTAKPEGEPALTPEPVAKVQAEVSKVESIRENLRQWDTSRLTEEDYNRIRSQAIPIAFSDKRLAQLMKGEPLSEGEIALLKSGNYSILNEELIKARPDLFPEPTKTNELPMLERPDATPAPEGPATVLPASVEAPKAPESQAPSQIIRETKYRKGAGKGGNYVVSTTENGKVVRVQEVGTQNEAELLKRPPEVITSKQQNPRPVEMTKPQVGEPIEFEYHGKWHPGEVTSTRSIWKQGVWEVPENQGTHRTKDGHDLNFKPTVEGKWSRLGAQNVRRPVGTSESQGAIATPGPPLAPSATPAPVLPPKSQRQIITDIAQGLNLPIRFGRLRTNRFAGYFLKLQNLIGSKRANDIPIVSHEAGHKLDATFNFSNDPALRAELEMLGDPAAVAGSRSSWTKSKTLKYKRGEGVAEFVRYYLTDPPAAAQHAPNMARAFEAALDSNKDFGDTMRQAQSDIRTWRNAEPQARLRSHISVGGNPNKTPYTMSQLTRDLVDDLHFLRLAANDAKAAGTDLAASENPYTLARNLRGSYGMADSFIRSGVADFKTKEVTLGTSLQDALKPVAGRIADFRDWIIAKRAQEIHAQGRQTGLVDSDVAFTAAKFDGEATFQDAFAKVKAWQDSLLQYSVDSGFVTADGAAAMRAMNADYVPLHRVFEVGAGEAPAIEGSGTGRGLNVGKPGSLRRLSGSARDIVDPLETMVRNAYAIITASEKHAINLAVADMARLKDMGKWVEHIKTPQERVKVGVEKLREQLEAEGADMTNVPDDVMLQFFQNSKQAPFGENVIKVVRDGKPEFYRLRRELFETFNALDLEDSGTLVRMLSAPSQVLRAGVVLDPSFALANVMRDAFTSAIVSRHSLLPFEATYRGVAAMLKNPKLVAEWEAAGGKNAIEANYFDRQKLQKFLAEKITKDLTPTERALIAVKSPLQALRWLTSLGEEATRIGEYQKAFEDLRKGGMAEGDARRQAAFESRDRQDFAKGGAKTKIPRRLAAFWNAGIQGNVRLAQAFRERPLQTTLKGLAFITIPKLIEQALNWDDDDYWDRPQWERDLFFLIPAGKGEGGHTRFIRIPTPFEAGVIFGTLPGRILQSIKEGNAGNMKGFPLVLANQTIPNPTPQFALTIFEDFLVGKKGYDVYRQRQIVPESISQLPADMQWTEQTSLTARKLGAALGFPPVKIDHIINQTTGGLGKQVTHQIVDRAISLATGEARTAKGVVPGGRFVTTPATVSSQSIEEFYSTLDKVKTAAAGQKKGRDDELARWKPMFTAAESQLSEMRRQMRATKDEAEKNAIAERILALSRSTMKNFKEQTQ